MELVEVLAAQPPEVWGAIGLVVVGLLMVVGILLGRRRRRPSRPRASLVPGSRKVKPDPVLLGAEGRGIDLSAVDFDSQQTLIPAGFAVRGPHEAIDLLSPDQDQVMVSGDAPDPDSLDAAKRTVAAAVKRVGGAGRTDNLTQIRGLSPVHARKLYRAGIRSFAQLGELQEEELSAVATLLSCSIDQIRDDDWVGQARAQIGV